MRKSWIVSLTIVAVVVLLISAIAFRPKGPSTGPRAGAEGTVEQSGEGSGAEGEDAAREAGEHVGIAVTAADVDRITRAEARAMAPAAAAAGWAGEIKLGVEDTWEPTIAADPSSTYVYAMYNRFGGPKACKQCPGTRCTCVFRAITARAGVPRTTSANAQV